MSSSFETIRSSADRPCICGRTHQISLDNMILGEGVLSELPKAVESVGRFRHVTIVADKNTFRAAGQTVLSLIPAGAAVLDPENLHANEIGVEKAEALIPADADLLIAVGSGTIHDITRYVAYRRHLPFLSVPTAASVDGFVSTVAAMTWNGVKRTLTAVGPTLMVADSLIMKDAPKALTAAGVGDLLGKYTALADWKAGKILKNEYYCPEIVRLEEEALENVVRNIDQIAACDAKGIELLQYGLVLSGLAMQMAGNSRPASGAEHHFSHLIEMHVLNPENQAFHGEKVGVGTGYVLDEYHRLADLAEEELFFDPALYADEAEIRRVFGPLSGEILKENEKNPLDGLNQDLLRSGWPKIRELIRTLPTGDQVRNLLTIVSGSTTLSDLSLPDGLLPPLLRYSPLVRNRLTLMRIRNHLR
ncbi:MAG: sn-glycerol-1-phosphate dehydrogenase [Lachnospiraceae bacterium]|nr:sn-glycerol-1-phosphate dehydrogenase [Lachnospiraceae bacterium]MBR4767956.1 sn-glycerol-1-phosphate dehydrogenase [Lachnospiraceae bacterium]